MEIDFTGLNPAQKEAVETISGPLLVLAGAGTGKTRVITYRIVNLLKNWISPENILAMTFTNKAAREMRERVKELVRDKSSKKIFLGTFHAFCIRLLRAEVKNTELHSGFTIADDVDQSSIYKQVLAEVGAVKEDINLHRYRISNAKNELISPDEFTKKNGLLPGYNLTAKIYVQYQDTLILQNMLDFDDILSMTVKLWENNPEILAKYQDTYKYLLVDEFQDTNQAQFRIVELLAGERKNICVVGDDDQSIYGWRGAKVENILDFPKKFPGAKTIKLEQNYRSTNTILKAANSFIAGNKRRHNKTLWSKNGEGPKIKLHQSETDTNESVFVSNEIYRIMMQNSSVKHKDIAVLYRSNHQSRLFEQQFRKDNVPYRLVGSRSFYDRREIRDAVAYLKLIVNPRDDQSFLRIIGVPSRGLGKKAISALRDLQAEKQTPLCFLLNNKDFIAGISGKGKKSAEEFYFAYEKWNKELAEPGNLAIKVRSYFFDIGFLNGFQKMYKNIEEAETRRENVTEFINAAAQYEDNLDEEPKLIDFLESVSLSDDNDKVDEDEDSANSVTLSTVHAAKGLEFPFVFVVGMEQGMFPHSRSVGEEGEGIDEERRLFYVAVTRAKERLTLTSSKTRYKFGRKEYQYPSSFPTELPEELVETNITEAPVEENIVKNSFSSFYEQFDL